MLKFVLCDDNKNLLTKMSDMLDNIFLKHSLDGTVSLTTSDVKELFCYIENNKVDVLILDINLHSEMTGLQVAEQIRKYNKNLYIIFTTAYFEYVLTAYKYKTFDYLCKPVSKEKLEETILRLFEDASSSEKKKYLKLDNKNTIINQDEIEYIKRDGMKLIFHTSNRDYEVYSSFAKIQNKLPGNFMRCHKSFVVNTHNISELKLSENLIYFKNDSFCELGPKYKNHIMEVFNNGNIE